MISEDYVSFETAKLLKEKGFDENCAALYNLRNGEFREKQTSYVFNNSQWDSFITAPTLQMVMKWLREVHNLFIVIDRHYFVVDKISHIASGFKYSIEIKTINTVYIHTNYESFEEACEAAIKYCLENLI